MYEDLETTIKLLGGLVLALTGAWEWWRGFQARRQVKTLRPAFDEALDGMGAMHGILEAFDLLAKYKAPDSEAAAFAQTMKKKSAALIDVLSEEAPRLNEQVQETAGSVKRIVQGMRAAGASDDDVLEALLDPKSDLLQNALVASRERRRAKMLGEGAAGA